MTAEAKKFLLRVLLIAAALTSQVVLRENWNFWLCAALLAWFAYKALRDGVA